jgi:beta-galactosidase
VSAFLHSGEFHYFRVPRAAWQDRLSAMAGAGLNTVSIYVPWNWHSPADGVTDFTGENVPERDLPAVLAEIDAAGLDCIFRPGPFITAEWADGGMPSWLLRDYPETGAVTAEGKPASDGRAYPVFTHCHPVFRAKVRDWLERALAVAAPFSKDRGGPVATVYLDDEPSYWRTLTEPLMADYNPVLLDRYQGTPPREPARDHAGALAHLDWMEFKLAEVNDYVQFLYEVVHGTGVAGPGTGTGIAMLQPYLLAWSGVRSSAHIRANELPIQLTDEVYLALFSGSAVPEQKLGAVLAAQETYLMWQAGTPGDPATIEIQGSNSTWLSPGAMELLYALSIARGIRGLSYYMMVGGTNPPGFENNTGSEYDICAPISRTGEIRPHYDTIVKVGQLLGGWLGERLDGAQPLRDTWIGGYAPYEMAHFTGAAAALGMTEVAETFDGGDIGQSTANSLAALMALNSVSFGCLDLEAPIPQVPQLWVPGGTFMAEHAQQNLAGYVRSGGHLVIMPELPRLDERLQPCGILAELAGAPELTRRDAEVVTAYTESGHTIAAAGVMVTAQPPLDATILARDALTGQPCAYRLTRGEGTITYLGFPFRYTPVAGDGQHEFLLELLREPRAAATSARPFAAFQLQGEQAGLLCLANPLEVSGAPVASYTITSGEHRQLPELLPGVPFNGRGARLLPVNVALGDGLVLRHATWELTDVLLTGQEIELTFAVPGGAPGEVVLEGLGSPVRVEGGKVRESAGNVLVIDPDHDHVRVLASR